MVPPVPVASSAAAVPTPAEGYTKSCGITISPRAVSWIPAILLTLVVLGYPLVYSFWISLHEVSLGAIAPGLAIPHALIESNGHFHLAIARCRNAMAMESICWLIRRAVASSPRSRSATGSRRSLPER